MAFINETSWCCVGSQLDLFTSPPVMVTHEESILAEIPSLVDNADGDSPSALRFTINTPHYVDLAATKLYLRGKLVMADGSAVHETTSIAPVNMFLHAFIHNVDVMIGNNQQKVMENNDLYSYKAALETLVNFGMDAKNSTLQSILYHKDTAGKLDSMAEENTGFVARNEVVRGSKEFEVVGPLHVGLFFQEKYLLSRTKVEIVVHRTKPSFYLNSAAIDNKFMFKLSEAKLLVRYVDVASSVALAHEAALASSTAKYSYNHIEMRRIPITKHSMHFETINLFTNRIPKKMIITFVQTTSLQGALEYNPFNFKHFNVQDLSLTINGSKKIGFSKMDFAKSLYQIPYMNLYDAMNKSFVDRGMDITYKDFGAGYTIFAFDLTPDSCGNTSKHMETSEIGTVSVAGTFKERLFDNVTCLVYAEFENLLEITRERNAEVRSA